MSMKSELISHLYTQYTGNGLCAQCQPHTIYYSIVGTRLDRENKRHGNRYRSQSINAENFRQTERAGKQWLITLMCQINLQCTAKGKKPPCFGKQLQWRKKP